MKKRIAFAVLAAVLIAGTIVIMRSPVASRAIAAASEWARGAGALGVTVFVAAYVVATVLLIPGSVLTIAAGFIYGVTWGTVIAAPTSVVAATIAFGLGRTLARGPIERRFGGGRRFRAIDTAVAEREGTVVALLRLSPVVPFVALNYLLSITQVSVRTYVVASLLGMLPGTILYVYLGSLASTAAEAATGATGLGGARIALLIAGLVATIAAVVVIARLARRELARSGAAPDAQTTT